jgi:hypothetical protein
MTYDLDLGLIRLLSPKPQGFQQLTLVPFATNDLVFVASPRFYSTNRSNRSVPRLPARVTCPHSRHDNLRREQDSNPRTREQCRTWAKRRLCASVTRQGLG